MGKYALMFTATFDGEIQVTADSKEEAVRIVESMTDFQLKPHYESSDLDIYNVVQISK